MFDHIHSWSLGWESMGHRNNLEETWADTRSPDNNHHHSYRSESWVQLCQTLQTSPLEQNESGSSARGLQSHLEGRHLHMTHLKINLMILVNQRSDHHASPGVTGTGGDLVLLITVAAWIIDWTPGVGETVWRISNADLEHNVSVAADIMINYLGDKSAWCGGVVSDNINIRNMNLVFNILFDTLNIPLVVTIKDAHTLVMKGLNLPSFILGDL